MTYGAFLCLMALIVKHFVFDALAQPSAIYMNKGNLFHWAPYVHGGFHGIYTILIMICWLGDSEAAIWMAMFLGGIDFVFHIFIDFCKVHLTNFFDCAERGVFTPYGQEYCMQGLLIRRERFFTLFVLDQCLHFATYGWLIYLGSNYSYAL